MENNIEAIVTERTAQLARVFHELEWDEIYNSLWILANHHADRWDGRGTLGGWVHYCLRLSGFKTIKKLIKGPSCPLEADVPCAATPVAIFDLKRLAERYEPLMDYLVTGQALTRREGREQRTKQQVHREFQAAVSNAKKFVRMGR